MTVRYGTSSSDKQRVDIYTVFKHGARRGKQNNLSAMLSV